MTMILAGGMPTLIYECPNDWVRGARLVSGHRGRKLHGNIRAHNLSRLWRLHLVNPQRGKVLDRGPFRRCFMKGDNNFIIRREAHGGSR